MAAATVLKTVQILATPFAIYEWELGSITSHQQEVLSHGLTGMTPVRVDVFTTTEPTDLSAISGRLVSYSTSANTITVRLLSEAGGDPTGGKVKVWAWFFESASGGTTF